MSIDMILKPLPLGEHQEAARAVSPRPFPRDHLVAGDQQLLDLPFEVWNGLATAFDPGDDTVTRSALVVGPE
jgi:hypothetical protein